MYSPDKVDKIFAFFREQLDSKKMLNPEVWQIAAMELNLCRGDEEGELHERRRKVAEKKIEILDSMEKKNVSEAELRVEATEEYEEMKRQETRCDQIIEFGRLAKKNADLASVL